MIIKGFHETLAFIYYESVSNSQFIYLSRYIREPWCPNDGLGKFNGGYKEGENPNTPDVKGHGS
ncbi:hypothetical protein JCM16161A_23900 [Vulcanisaeta sp. JCM 16161]